MINLILSMKTLLFNEFISFKFFVAVNNNSIDIQILSLYNDRKKHYKILIFKYDKLIRKFDKTNALIQKTISTTNQFYIEKIEIHFYDILLIFQKKISFFDYERMMFIEKNYHKLRKEFKNQNVKKWLNEWMKIFNDAKIYKIKKVAKTKSLKKILLAINSIDSKFNLVHTTDFLNIVYSTTIIEQMLTLIEMFKHIIRMKKENKASFKFYFAFFVDENFTFIFFLFLLLIWDQKKKMNVYFFEKNQSNHFNAYVKKSIDFLNVSIL